MKTKVVVQIENPTYTLRVFRDVLPSKRPNTLFDACHYTVEIVTNTGEKARLATMVGLREAFNHARLAFPYCEGTISRFRELAKAVEALDASPVGITAEQAKARNVWRKRAFRMAFFNRFQAYQGVR